MESPRITVARALELGVRVSWREAMAIVHQAVAGTGTTEGAGPARVTAESCLITRGGDVLLAGTAAKAPPEAVVRLLDDLLASCSDPGRFAGAVANGTALDMIEELSQHTTPKRRRVEVAAVALRGLAAEAAAARAMADADAQGHHEVPRAAVAAPREQTAPEKAVPALASRFELATRASRVALVCVVLAVAASGILALQTPATLRSAVEPSQPAIEPPEIAAPVDRDLGLDTLPARPDPVLVPEEVAAPPSVPPLVARSAPLGSRIAEPRANGPETSAERMATVAEPGSPSTASAAAAIVAPDAATLSAGAPLLAVDLPFDVPSPSAAASSPAETRGSTATDVPATAARFPDRAAETRAIENVLGQYRTAFNNLDAGAASAVWPTVNEKTLAKAFERLESHDVSFERCQIEIFSVLAEAACSGSARYVPKVGSRTPKDEARQWRFNLRKASGEWLIDRVDAR